MATGRSMQLAGQVGEYLVAAQLCRHDLIAATFSGNVEHFDILASASDGRAVAVQVKTMRTGVWQLNASRFLDIEQRGSEQIVRGLTQEPHPGLICVFVKLGHEYGEDEFYVLTWRKVQAIVARGYRATLKKHGAVRPKNPESRHTAIAVGALEAFRDAWNTITMVPRRTVAAARARSVDVAPREPCEGYNERCS